jgi:hypothetical protein
MEGKLPHPCVLDTGNPCRYDGFNLMAVKHHPENRQNHYYLTEKKT